MNTQSERQENFYTWLAGQVPGTVLSDCHTCASDLDSFCVSRKLAETSMEALIQ